jgi:hypothetical protein
MSKSPRNPHQRIQRTIPDDELHELSRSEQIRHATDGILDAIALAAEGYAGQPPHVELLKRINDEVSRLMANGVPFATCKTSRMNKEIVKLLRDQTVNPAEPRKSRRTQSRGPGAVERWLQLVERLQFTSEQATNYPPYRK